MKNHLSAKWPVFLFCLALMILVSFPVLADEPEEGYADRNSVLPQGSTLHLTKVWEDTYEEDALFEVKCKIKENEEGAEAKALAGARKTGSQVPPEPLKVTESDTVSYTVEKVEPEGYNQLTFTIDVKDEHAGARRARGLQNVGTTVITKEITLPQSENFSGSYYDFEIRELTQGYKTTYGGNAIDGFYAKNQYDGIDIRVTKHWSEGLDRKPVTVELIRDGIDTGTTLTLQDDNQWTDSFRSLPRKNADNREYVYTIKELTSDYMWYCTGDAKNGFELYNNQPSVTAADPPVKKTLNGDTPQEDSTFEFTLKALPDKSRFESSDGTMPMPEAAAGEPSMTLSITGPQSGEFGDFTFTKPGTYVYEVTETDKGETGYTYDHSVYELHYEVTLTDNEVTGEHGILACDLSVYKNDERTDVSELEFANTYKAPEESSEDSDSSENSSNESPKPSSENSAEKQEPVKYAEAVKTGDTSHLAAWAGLLLAMVAVTAIVLLRRVSMP